VVVGKEQKEGKAMILLTLAIRNFKGLPTFTLPAAGRNVNIYGDNATGKTTIEDAYLWLLFDKNSEGATKFGIEPTGSRGQGIETSVIAEVENNGIKYKLEKRRSERWTTPRNATVKVMDGYDIKRLYDGLPMGEREFDSLIATLIPASLSKAITNPLYVNEQMKPDERRNMLLGLAGIPSDADIIASDEWFAPLTARGPHDVNDYKTILKNQRAAIGKELAEKQPRIDEATRTLGQDIDLADAGERKEKLTAEIRQLEASLNAPPTDTEQQIKRLQSDLSTLESENNAHISKQREEWQDAQRFEIEALKGKRACLMDKVMEQQTYQQQFGKQAVYYTNSAATIRTNMANLQKSVWDGLSVCPTCRRDMPADQIERSKAMFNSEKAKQLEEYCINATEYEKLAKTNQVEADKAATILADLNKQIEAADGKIREVQGRVFMANPMPEFASNHAKLLDKMLDLQAKAGSDETAQADRYYNIRLEAAKIQGQLTDLDRAIATTEQNAKTRARIEELKADKRRLGGEQEGIDKLLNLCEEFTRAKCSMITERVNGMFRIVRWQLFKEQINGGLADCCEAMVDAVPYTDLNNAARINAGLDIINTLSLHHGCTAPIFIDNAEAVTRLEPVDAQVIRLIVSEADKTLKVEVL
jgi:hypothetical protein